MEFVLYVASLSVANALLEEIISPARWNYSVDPGIGFLIPSPTVSSNSPKRLLSFCAA